MSEAVSVVSPSPKHNGRHHPRATWDAIRAAWLTGVATMPMLAAQYGITEGTIKNKAQREQWGKHKNAIASVSVANDLAQRSAIAIARPALTAQRLVQRTLTEAEKHLDRLASRCDAEPNDSNYSKLTGAWSQVVKIARLTHGLDSAEMRGKPRIDAVIDAEVIDVEPEAKQVGDGEKQG